MFVLTMNFKSVHWNRFQLDKNKISDFYEYQKLLLFIY